MEKLKDQVSKVSKSLDETTYRTRIMDKKLKSLEKVSSTESDQLLETKQEVVSNEKPDIDLT